MRGFRKLILCLILLFPVSLAGKNFHWNEGRGYYPFKYATKEGILIENQSDTLQYDYFRLNVPSYEFHLDFRSKNINGSPSKKYPYYNKKGQKISVGNPHWGFFITTEKDTFAITAKGEEKVTAFEPVRALKITLYNLVTGKSESVSMKDKVNPYDGDNLWNVTKKQGTIIIATGNHDINEVLKVPCNSDITGFGFFAGWGDTLKISDINVMTDEEEMEVTLYPVDTLKYYLSQSTDPMEGFWTLFDRELEESLLKLGGNYTLACVKDGEDYLLIYIEGANTNSRAWKGGDLKARLIPTPFRGIYNVDWIDAMKEHLNQDVKAQESMGNTLLIQFPYQSSQIRLRKIP